mgnify:CR=1 FL=1
MIGTVAITAASVTVIALGVLMSVTGSIGFGLPMAVGGMALGTKVIAMIWNKIFPEHGGLLKKIAESKVDLS